MNKKEAIKKLKRHGIHQLNKGESLKDAIDYVDGKMPSRNGYKIKSKSGRKLAKHEVIAEENKRALAKMVSTPEWRSYDLNNVQESDVEDQRTDESCKGWLEQCEYCGKPLRVDEGYEGILNCEEHIENAILEHCM